MNADARPAVGVRRARLRGVFSPAEAAAMEERVWSALEKKHAIARDDPRSWKLPPATGLQSLRTHSVFEPIGGPRCAPRSTI